MSYPSDQETADKFANSWNNVYNASVYTEAQFEEWIAPWKKTDLKGKNILELGCGSGALMFHVAQTQPQKLMGIDLGDSVNTARKLLKDHDVIITQGDITNTRELLKLGRFDRVYCIGVLHHLKKPEEGIQSLLAMTLPGGQFHGWVYAHEGNSVVRYLVDPLRRMVNHLPWFVNKYLVALPLTIPFFIYSNFCRIISYFLGKTTFLPLFDYMMWISKRGFDFHHHVAFDQLVTPVTHYIKKERVESWLKDERIEEKSSYILFRNGNGWKFGGRIRSESP